MSNMTTPPDDKQNLENLSTDAVDGSGEDKQRQEVQLKELKKSNDVAAIIEQPSHAPIIKPLVNQPNTKLADTELVESELAEKVISKKNCENCGFELDGPFCGRCGQSERTTIKFFGSVIMHFLDDVFGYDSRAARTVFPLIFRPGFLTCEYFKGRRVHYVPPLRLYFFISIMFLSLIHI